MKKTIVPLLFFLVCLALKATQPSLSQLQFAERNVVLLQDKAHLLPLQGLDTLRIACISMGTPAENEFSAMLGKYMKVKMFAVNAQNMDSVASCLPEYNLTVLGIFGNRLTERELAFVAAQRKNTWSNRLFFCQSFSMVEHGWQEHSACICSRCRNGFAADGGPADFRRHCSSGETHG